MQMRHLVRRAAFNVSMKYVDLNIRHSHDFTFLSAGLASSLVPVEKNKVQTTQRGKQSTLSLQ